MAPIPRRNKRKNKKSGSPKRRPKRRSSVPSSSNPPDAPRKKPRTDQRLADTMAVLADPFMGGASVVARNLIESFSVEKVTKTSRKRYQEDDGMAGGKFSKAGKSNPFAVYTRRGITETQECGSLVKTGTGLVSGLPLYVGHATHGNIGMIVRTFFRQMVVRLFSKGGINIVDLETESPGAGNFSVEYVTDLNATGTLITSAMAGKSYNQIASDLIAGFDTAWATVAGQKFITINEASIDNGSITLAKIDYRRAMIHVMCKSDLKVQNRSTAPSTDNPDDDNNVAKTPLYGKIYYGKGNGLLPRVDTLANSGKSLATGVAGLLAYAPPASQYWLKEPPQPTLFSVRPKTSRALLNPGVIKNSGLTAKWSCSMQDFFQILQRVSGVAKGDVVQNRYGKFAILAMEKLLCTGKNVAADEPAVAIALELNQRMGLYCTFKKGEETAEVVPDAFFIDPAT